jgi:hypothetical protein
MPMDELNVRYADLRGQYDALIAQTLTSPATISTTLPQIQSLNQQIAAVLDQMLTDLQYARNGPNSDAYRDRLLEQLTRIQTDYTGLKTNTDSLETLRRIRSFQDDSWKPSLLLHVVALVAAAILLVLLMLFRRQTSESTIAPPMSPTAMPTLT